MKILIDSNIALDSLLERYPFHVESEKVIDLASDRVDVLISASAVTDVFYITSREKKSKQVAMSTLKGLLRTVKIAPLDDADIRRAIALDWDDFEDAVQFAAGERAGVDFIVTRDKTNYAKSTIPVVAPAELIALLQA